MSDTKISAFTDGSPLQSSDDFVIARSGANYKIPGSQVVPPGSTVLVYRYTIAGSDKTSIDTGVDTAQAGANDWTNTDLIEIWLSLRTDEAVALSSVNMVVNNDTSSIYNLIVAYGLGGTPTAGQTQTNLSGNWLRSFAGSSCAAGVFGSWRLQLPVSTGQHLNGTAQGGVSDSSSGNSVTQVASLNYGSSTALSRFAVTPSTGGQKLKVGSQILIYKRTAS